MAAGPMFIFSECSIGFLWKIPSGKILTNHAMNYTTGINLRRYYVNKNALINGRHELHKDDCNFLPKSEVCIDLGIHMNYHSAIIKAMDYFKQLNCCFCCTHDCKPN